jgi:hypothetical protein
MAMVVKRASRDDYDNDISCCFDFIQVESQPRSGSEYSQEHTGMLTLSDIFRKKHEQREVESKHPSTWLHWRARKPTGEGECQHWEHVRC